MLIVLALLLLPGAVWLERAEPNLWNERLFLPNLIPVIHKHTSLYSQGRFLPGIITADLTLSPQDNPVIITSATTIPAGITLTIAPDTHVYVAEFGQLDVVGTITAVGTTEKPITFTTNEVYPLNRTWNGIILRPYSTATLEHLTITAASPGITCEAGSNARMTTINIQETSMGIFNASTNCQYVRSL